MVHNFLMNEEYRGISITMQGEPLEKKSTKANYYRLCTSTIF